MEKSRFISRKNKTVQFMAQQHDFGTIEYVMDRYSQAWSWKITGSKAISMVSKMIAQSWYGDGVGEVIVPDNVQNIQQLPKAQFKDRSDRHPLEILSKSVWKRKSVKPRQKMAPMIQKYTLKRAKPKAQFKGKLLDFQKEGLDFLLKSSGNALHTDFESISNGCLSAIHCSC